MFTMEEMDMVLYGYAKAKQETPSGGGTGHALSGLRIGELSYGEYSYILYPCSCMSCNYPTSKVLLVLVSLSVCMFVC